MDEGYFTVESSEIEQKNKKKGRGVVGKQNVIIIAESTPLEDPETGNKERQCCYFKAKVLDDHKAEGINGTVASSLDQQNIVFTDKNTSYINIADFIELHISEKSDKKTRKKL